MTRELEKYKILNLLYAIFSLGILFSIDGSDRLFGLDCIYTLFILVIIYTVGISLGIYSLIRERTIIFLIPIILYIAMLLPAIL